MHNPQTAYIQEGFILGRLTMILLPTGSFFNAQTSDFFPNFELPWMANICTFVPLLTKTLDKMKKVFLFLSAAMLTISAFAGTTLRYYNEDSKDYKLQVVTCGNHTEVTFDHSKTTSVTIQGCSDAVISTPSGDLKVKDGDKVHIKNGKFEVVSSL